METFRCPSCLFVLLEAEPTRCPSCHKRLGRRRARPIVLGNKYKFGTNPPPHIDLTHLEPIEPPAEPVEAPPATPAVPVASPPAEPEPIRHTTIFEPSQLNPELREVLDELYRKARADIRDERK
jgi:hypothetical protein